ncbi:MAG: hypothetical protein H7843_06295 [Nitrospirota bacterium]
MNLNGTSIVADSSGVTYITTLNTYNLSSDNITTKFMVITSSGIKHSMTINGMVERLVLGKDRLSNDILVVICVIPGALSGNPSTVLYFITLPFDQNIDPVSVKLTGEITSKPEFVSGTIEITTRVVFGDKNNSTTSYLYVIDLQGSIISQISY